MFRYFFVSSIAHLSVISAFAFSSLFHVPTKEYYTVDFMGGGPGAAGGGSEAQTQTQAKTDLKITKETRQPEVVKKVVKNIDPKEDLLVKSKGKNKKEKVKLSAIPEAPPDRSASPVYKTSDIPAPAGEIPSVGSGSGSGSGVGVGFGDSVTGGGGAGNFPYTWYVNSVKKKLDSNWNVTGGFSQRTHADVAFTIQRNGFVVDVKVEESSGIESFDLAARRAVEYSNPFAPLPNDFQEPNIRVHVRFTVKQ